MRVSREQVDLFVFRGGLSYFSGPKALSWMEYFDIVIGTAVQIWWTCGATSWVGNVFQLESHFSFEESFWGPDASGRQSTDLIFPRAVGQFQHIQIPHCPSFRQTRDMIIVQGNIPVRQNTGGVKHSLWREWLERVSRGHLPPRSEVSYPCATWLQ